MWPRFTDATIAVAVRGLRGVIAAAAACAAAVSAAMTWRVRAMPATPTLENALMFVMIAATLLSSARMILRLSVAAVLHNQFSDLQVWHDFYGDWRPLTKASTAGPNCSSLRAPMPGIATSAASSVGSVSAIAMSVLSVNTTYAGTPMSLEVRSRQSLRSASSCSSMSDGQASQRRSMTAAGVVRALLQTRQRGVGPRAFLGFPGLSACEFGAMPLRKRDGRRPCLPPGLRASAQLSAKYTRALVIPT